MKHGFKWQYGMVSTGIWRECRRYKLSVAASLLYFFALTCPLKSIFGFYKLPLLSFTELLPLEKKDTKHSTGQVLAALRELDRYDLILYDEKIQIVVVPGWFSHNSTRVIKPVHVSIMKQLYDEIPHTSPIFGACTELVSQVTQSVKSSARPAT